jgi:hypothetical protein
LGSDVRGDDAARGFEAAAGCIEGDHASSRDRGFATSKWHVEASSRAKAFTRSRRAWASPRMVENEGVEPQVLSVLVDSPLRWLAITLAALVVLVYVADKATGVVRENVDWWQTRSRRWPKRRSRKAKSKSSHVPRARRRSRRRQS